MHLLNPLAPIFELARKWMIDPTAPAPAERGRGAAADPVVLYVGICVLAAWVFNREAPRIAEEL